MVVGAPVSRAGGQGQGRGVRTPILGRRREGAVGCICCKAPTRFMQTPVGEGISAWGRLALDTRTQSEVKKHLTCRVGRFRVPKPSASKIQEEEHSISSVPVLPQSHTLKLDDKIVGKAK